MLDAEEARARLESRHNPDWHEQLQERVQGLPPELRDVASAFAQPTPTDFSLNRRTIVPDAVHRAARPLDASADAERAEVFSALLPGLGAALARWWVDAVGSPYTDRSEGLAFRSPSAPDRTLRRRTERVFQVLYATGPYDPDPEWLAAWAPHLHEPVHVTPDPFIERAAGEVLAAAVDLGGDAGEHTLRTLLEIAAGDHPIGRIDRHAVTALLGCTDPAGWDHAERMLLAAQRQEGLRQLILDSAPYGHRRAFQRVLRLVLEHDLLRFAATVRAVGQWVGFVADVTEIPRVRDRVEMLEACYDDLDRARSEVAVGDPWDVFIALCATAMSDAELADELAEVAMGREDPAARATAVRFWVTAGGSRRLLPAFDDSDLSVAMLVGANSHSVWGASADRFEHLARLAERLPAKKRTVDPIGVETRPITLDRSLVVHDLYVARGEHPLGEFLPWVPFMAPETRERFVAEAAKRTDPSPEVRRAVLDMLADRSRHVRSSAASAIRKHGGITPSEAPHLEAMLTRTTGDLRRNVIRLLAAQPTEHALASASRLWAEGDDSQRDAACEVLVACPDRTTEVVALARTFRDETRSTARREILAPVAGEEPSDGSDDWGLGLFDPESRTPAGKLGPRVRRYGSDAALRIVSELDDLVHAHRDTPIVVTTRDRTDERLLGDHFALPSPFRAKRDPSGTALVLPDLFRAWWSNRPDELRDAGDGLDALRAYVAVVAIPPPQAPGAITWDDPWWEAVGELVGGRPDILRHPRVVTHVLSWLLVDAAGTDVVDECLDGMETLLLRLSESDTDLENGPNAATLLGQKLDFAVRHPWGGLVEGLFVAAPQLLDAERTRRWFDLHRWRDALGFRLSKSRHFLPERVLLHALDTGVANEHDLYDVLISDRYGTALTRWTRRRRDPFVADHPEAAAIVDRLRDRIIDVECRRGDLPTKASRLAVKLASIEGAATTVELLHRMGSRSLVRGRSWGDQSRDAVLSHLLRVSYPAASDRPAALEAAARERDVSDLRLVELALFAPQWADLVEGALGWTGLANAVWWYHAHAKDRRWHVDKEIRETWAAMSAERTALDAEDLMDGAVDVDWFRRAQTTLGNERWDVVHSAAKMTSGGLGHRRAQVVADAIRGRVEESVLVERITTKRNQDAVRAIGLVPLPDDEHDRSAATLRRYQVIREFERGARTFGSQRQASERNAARIGIENLARTAGHDDAQRLIWEMEATEAGELADGPVSTTEGDVTVTLSVDDEGVAALSVARGTRTLKSIPAGLRKAPAVIELRERFDALSRQRPRVRAALEAAMVDMATFTAGDLHALQRHPVVAPMLELSLFVDEAGRVMRRHGDGFRTADGQPSEPQGAIRLAHPVDLVAADWIAWQEALFDDATRQPFKQAFRELYVPTASELEAGPGSHRWDGHQIQPRQAAALFSARGWLHNHETADLSKVFHVHGYVARVTFVDGFMTPAEVELPTIDGVWFAMKGQWGAQPLDAVPPILFSEVMRDLDLVVSVAHAGGVDPEASASTIEMRIDLVRETARLAKLANVRLVGHHAVIEGALGEYSVHLGSGTVHRRPGGAVCIIPVDAQRRGRLFLPFADDDPKTAEIVSKVLLLARDKEIKDPAILEQLRS